MSLTGKIFHYLIAGSNGRLLSSAKEARKRGQNRLTQQGCRFEEAALSRDDLSEVEWRILKVFVAS